MRSRTISRKAGDVNIARLRTFIGIVKVEGMSKVIIFGGFGEKDPVEEWNDEEEIWEISTNFSLPQRDGNFAHC